MSSKRALNRVRNKPGWRAKITFPELVSEIMREDFKTAERDELEKRHGYGTFDHE